MLDQAGAVRFLERREHLHQRGDLGAVDFLGGELLLDLREMVFVLWRNLGQHLPERFGGLILADTSHGTPG